MEILDFIKKNADAFTGIPAAAEVIGQVVAKMQELGYTALANNSKTPEYIDKGRFDQVSSQAGELTKQLEALKKAAKGNEELTKTIEELQKKNQDWEAKYKDGMLVNAIKLAAMKANARDAGDVLALIDKSKLSLKDDNTVDGLEEQLRGLKETKGYLFGETVPVPGANPATDAQKTPDAKVASDFAAALKGF